MKQNLIYRFPDGSKVPVKIHAKEAARLGWTHGTLFKPQPRNEETVLVEWITQYQTTQRAYLPASGLRSQG